MLLLFVLCALVPILVVGVASYQQVTTNLRELAESRLRESSRTLGMSIIGRLMFAESEFIALSRQPTRASAARLIPPDTVELALRPWFVGVARQRGDRWEILAGSVTRPEPVDADQAAHMAAGGTTLALGGPDGDRRVLMGRTLSAAQGGGTLWGEVAPAYLWQPQEFQGETTLPDPCILGPDGGSLFCLIEPTTLRRRLDRTGGRRATFEWEAADGMRIASTWPVFLRARYGAPSWSVVLSEPQTQVLGPIAAFRRSFPLMLLLSLLVVLLASNYQIRRSMEPVAALKGGTERIADWELDARVRVDTDDEFGDLARSFNVMARRLQRQFNALRTASELDRAVLATIRRESVVATVLERTPDLVPCEHVVLTLVEEIHNGMATACYRPPGGDTIEEPVWLTKQDVGRFVRHAESAIVEAADAEVQFLPQPLRQSERTLRWEIFPILVKGELVGILAVGLTEVMALEADDRLRARQLADQVGVALANAGLVDELEELSWGALRALARAIDAKSHWTSGHSERVAALSVAVARELELPEDEVERIRRGALLHDIGKIGVPAAVLDKAGKLTPEERRQMESHVVIGARILEPVRQFGPVIPIVMHHHERYDGNGYPSGLGGESIPLHARIVCVADVFDALTTDRPYRQGRSKQDTLEEIQREAGKHFDPRVAAAFVAVATRTLPERTKAVS